MVVWAPHPRPVLIVKCEAVAAADIERADELADAAGGRGRSACWSGTPGRHDTMVIECDAAVGVCRPTGKLPAFPTRRGCVPEERACWRPGRVLQRYRLRRASHPPLPRHPAAAVCAAVGRRCGGSPGPAHTLASAETADDNAGHRSRRSIQQTRGESHPIIPRPAADARTSGAVHAPAPPRLAGAPTRTADRLRVAPRPRRPGKADRLAPAGDGGDQGGGTPAVAALRGQDRPLQQWRAARRGAECKTNRAVGQALLKREGGGVEWAAGCAVGSRERHATDTSTVRALAVA